MNIEAPSVITGLFTNSGANTDQVMPSMTSTNQQAELSLLSNIPPGMTLDSFTAALSQQLQLTNPKTVGETAPTLTPQAQAGSGLGNFFTPVEGMQEISQLLGKQLPVAKKLDTTQEIDLNQTMETLTDVLGRISTAVGTLTSTVDSSTTNKPLSQNFDKTNITDEEASTELLQPTMINPLITSEPVSSVTDLKPKQSDVAKDDNSPTTETMLENQLAQLIVPTAFTAGKIDNNTQASSIKSTNSIVLASTSNSESLTISAKLSLAPNLTNPETINKSIKSTNPVSTTNVSISTDSTNSTGSDNSIDFMNTSVASSDAKLDPMLENPNINEIPNSRDQSVENNASRILGDIQQLGQQLKSSDKIELPTISKHLYSSDWNQELGSKILWMNNQNISSADIKLNPEHLGPITVRIDMHNEQTNIAFTAQNAGVRDILEASIPKLREMFSAHQLNLTDVNVSQHSFSGQQNHTQTPYFQQNGESNHQNRELTDDSENETTIRNQGVTDEIMQSRAIATNGLVSVYA